MGPPRGILVDTNLLVLLVVGLERPDHVSRWKRTSKYSLRDFALLHEVVGGYDHLAVTPHVLAEASNLLGQNTEPLRGKLLRRLGLLVLTVTIEYAVPSTDIVPTQLYVRLGMADAGISLLAGRLAAIITADLDLYVALTKASGHSTRVINFTHLQFESPG